MISPTGRGIRSDAGGQGYYGARRTTHMHKGVDFETKVGQEVVAPFDMTIQRIAKPNSSDLSGIAFKGRSCTGKMFYFTPTPVLIGKEVTKGQVIGIAQELQSCYGPKVGDHVHLQFDSVDVNLLWGVI